MNKSLWHLYSYANTQLKTILCGVENAAKWEWSVWWQQSSWVWVNALKISRHISAALPMPSDDLEIKVSGEEIWFSLLKLGLLTSVFFLTCLNISRSIQYQGRWLLVRNVMALLPWKKYLWKTSNYSLGVQSFPDSCTGKMMVLLADQKGYLLPLFT